MALRGQAALGPLGDEAEPAAMLLAGSHVLGRLEARLEEHGKRAEALALENSYQAALWRQQRWVGIPAALLAAARRGAAGAPSVLTYPPYDLRSRAG